MTKTELAAGLAMSRPGIPQGYNGWTRAKCLEFAADEQVLTNIEERTWLARELGTSIDNPMTTPDMVALAVEWGILARVDHHESRSGVITAPCTCYKCRPDLMDCTFN